MSRDNFLIVQSTSKTVKEVIDQIEGILHQKGITIFARISHSEAAKEAGLQMPDEELVVFGNPKVGTALMLDNPAIGIELPLKVLAWQEGNQTKVAYQNLNELYALFNINTAIPATAALKTFMENLVSTILK